MMAFRKRQNMFKKLTKKWVYFNNIAKFNRSKPTSSKHRIPVKHISSLLKILNLFDR